jgi:hypothetical protein
MDAIFRCCMKSGMKVAVDNLARLWYLFFGFHQKPNIFICYGYLRSMYNRQFSIYTPSKKRICINIVILIRQEAI